ncbi:MAG: hypothetical protein HOE11_05085 [Candidatus Diapherotrites archaeon]|jgi:hypothetical protein|nr:hypothetical protein [Candidatus Diapherotrites archaeon]MBT4597305.1 hypothetical protein [Candidatus Diapherotrites archaeon]
MSSINSMIIKEKISIKNLKLFLDEDDVIIDCIKQGMVEHTINECNVTSVNGKIKSGLISYMDKSRFKSAELNNQEILKASGNFKCNYNDFCGKLNVFTAGRKPLSGSLTKGIAQQDFEIILRFIQ